MMNTSKTRASIASVGLVVYCVVISCATMDVPDYFPEIQGDLTKATWAHAVNNKALLQEALDGDVMMLEADVVMGVLLDDGDHVTRPVMAHPPDNTSDLSLDAFLRGVVSRKGPRKGIKLDFKATETLAPSLEILRNFSADLNFPVWLNADILRGPVNNTGLPVDAGVFLHACADAFPDSQLSVGWKTTWGPLYSQGSYTAEHVEEMIQVLGSNQVTQTLTFPVRGGIAANSLDNLQRLVDAVPNSTLTVWSSADDAVDAGLLRRVILAVGRDKVYVDVPQDLQDELGLDSPL